MSAAIQFDKYKVLPIDKMVKAVWNYKTDSPELLEKLKANIKRNGQVENILVRLLDTGFYEIVNGNHRAQALMDLGMTEAVVFDLGKISDAQARRIAIETNETKFETDNIRLAEVIKEITDEFADLDDLSKSMPYSPEELTNFNKLLTFDWEQYQSGSTEAGDGHEGPQDGQEPPQDEDYSDGQGRFVLEFKTDEERQFWMDMLSIDGSMYSYTVEQYRATHPQSPFEDGK